jgi:hypothetical protein
MIYRQQVLGRLVARDAILLVNCVFLQRQEL